MVNIVGPPDVRQDQCLYGRLPFLGLVLRLGKARDVIGGVLKGDEAATTRQWYWIFETSLSITVSHRPAVWRHRFMPIKATIFLRGPIPLISLHLTIRVDPVRG
jgi:hypothetical protein